MFRQMETLCGGGGGGIYNIGVNNGGRVVV